MLVFFSIYLDAVWDGNRAMEMDFSYMTSWQGLSQVSGGSTEHDNIINNNQIKQSSHRHMPSIISIEQVNGQENPFWGPWARH